MSTLKDIKKLVIENPNDSDLGAKVRQYVVKHITCCDNPENIITFADHDSHPYGKSVSGTKCKKCGDTLDIKID